MSLSWLNYYVIYCIQYGTPLCEFLEELILNTDNS